jgi:hypothetical protein
MSRPITKPKKIKRPDDMIPVEIDGVIHDPYLPREQKLAILKDLILSKETTATEKKTCIEAHSILAGETKDTNTFVLKIEVMSEKELQDTIESRVIKPIKDIITK